MFVFQISHVLSAEIAAQAVTAAKAAGMDCVVGDRESKAAATLNPLKGTGTFVCGPYTLSRDLKHGPLLCRWITMLYWAEKNSELETRDCGTWPYCS